MLKKSQHECKDLKNKYKQTVLALKRSQLENNRYSSNAEALQVKYQTLEEENKNLNDQNVYLDERYNKHLIESMNTIKDLQDELQMIQELKSDNSKDKKENLRNMEQGNLIEENEKLKTQITQFLKQKKKYEEGNGIIINDLQYKNKEYVNKVQQLELQVSVKKSKKLLLLRLVCGLYKATYMAYTKSVCSYIFNE